MIPMANTVKSWQMTTTRSPKEGPPSSMRCKKREISSGARGRGGGDTANGRNSILYELEGWRNAAEAAPSSISTTAPYLSLRSDEVNGLAFVYVDHAFWKGSHDS